MSRLAHGVYEKDGSVITIEQKQGSSTCIARVLGDLDADTVPDLISAVDDAVACGCRVIVCDLERVSYMDSSALGFLVWADRRLGPVSGRLVLAGASADVSRIIELSGLIGIVPSVTASVSVEDALSGMRVTAEASEPDFTESFSFPAELSRMASVRARIFGIVEPLGLPESAQFDLKVAVGEALANAIRHGSPRGVADEVSVQVGVYPDRVVVAVSDAGCGFDGEPVTGSDVYAANGRGVLFMRALADFVEFARGEGGGTCVRLGKRRSLLSGTAGS